MATSQLRAIGSLTRSLRIPQRAFATTARQFEAAVPSKSETSAAVENVEHKEIGQAPNRLGIWSRTQKPRSQAMTGPRFEQTDFDLQVGEWRASFQRCSSC